MKIIAIDGPSGVGKSEIAKSLAKKLNYFYLDTGATYRCVALYLLENNIDLKDKKNIVNISKKLNINIDENGKVYLNTIDVSNKIRTKEIDEVVSYISNIVELRKHLVSLIRNLSYNKNTVTDGRDTTTVVFPNASYKFYVDADISVRAKRRYSQYKKMGVLMSMDEIIDNINKRDYNDKHKKAGALVISKKAIYIDTTNMDLDSIINKMIEYIGCE